MMREKVKALGGDGVCEQRKTLRMTQETAIGIGTSEEASGTQCDASFFRLARALSGWCSWASLGIVLRAKFGPTVGALPQRTLYQACCGVVLGQGTGLALGTAVLKGKCVDLIRE